MPNPNLDVLASGIRRQSLPEVFRSWALLQTPSALTRRYQFLDLRRRQPLQAVARSLIWQFGLALGHEWWSARFTWNTMQYERWKQ